MRVRVEEIQLIGAERTIRFQPGLNVVTGPIASGKTTLIKLVRFLLGGAMGNLAPEAREAVTAVGGDVVLAESQYAIVRPTVTTSSAKVEIAGRDATWRLPARSSGEEMAYVEWLLSRLNLPQLQVPSAPTHPESEPTPVSINDYWLYSYLSQEELGFSVFGHKDTYKNIKRKYVFDIVYGFYDIETAELQERLRGVLSQLRQLRSEEELFASFFEDTALANRAALQLELAATRGALAEAEAEAVALADIPDKSSHTAELQATVLQLEKEIERLKASLSAEASGISNLEALVSQLESQSAKLTRSIVSGKHLTDIDFVVCPRCGTSVGSGRAHEQHLCYLCLQEPSLDFSREVLVKEQEAVEAQLVESQHLLRARRERLHLLRSSWQELEDELTAARTELDFQTRAYVSANAERIATAAARRSTLKSRERQIREYLAVLGKRDQSQRRRAELVVEKERLEEELDREAAESAQSEARVQRLEERFNEILERFRPPAFGEEERSSIDRTSYLPIYHGRRFDNLSSPGLATLVNVAHALAHHLTAIQEGLRLPNLLIIDGLSEHLGQEGLDPERLAAVYDFLVEVSDEFGDQLQMIIVDNEVPDRVRSYVRLELSETDRLIPEAALRSSRAPGNP